MKTLQLISVVGAGVALAGCATQLPSNNNGAYSAPPPNPGNYSEGPPPPTVAETLPRAIQRVDPVYPLEAQQRGIVGVVAVVFDVDTNGKVVFATITASPDPLLSQAVVDAISQWKFIPGMQNGQKAVVRMNMSFTFGRAAAQ